MIQIKIGVHLTNVEILQFLTPDIAKKTQCDNCNVPFFGKNPISHIVECWIQNIYDNSNQKKRDCFICTQKNFPTNERLIQHLSSVHKRFLKKKKKCDLCMKQFHGWKNVTGMPIPEKISHLIDCHEKNRNKAQVEFISNQKMLQGVQTRFDTKQTLIRPAKNTLLSHFMDF